MNKDIDILAIYAIVDEFIKEFDKYVEQFFIGKKPKKSPSMSTSEIITIMILFQLSGHRHFKGFYNNLLPFYCAISQCSFLTIVLLNFKKESFYHLLFLSKCAV